MLLTFKQALDQSCLLIGLARQHQWSLHCTLWILLAVSESSALGILGQGSGEAPWGGAAGSQSLKVTITPPSPALVLVSSGLLRRDISATSNVLQQVKHHP
jgi:hypothetical protein